MVGHRRPSGGLGGGSGPWAVVVGRVKRVARRRWSCVGGGGGSRTRSG